MSMLEILTLQRSKVLTEPVVTILRALVELKLGFNYWITRFEDALPWH